MKKVDLHPMCLFVHYPLRVTLTPQVCDSSFIAFGIGTNIYKVLKQEKGEITLFYNNLLFRTKSTIPTLLFTLSFRKTESR